MQIMLYEIKKMYIVQKGLLFVLLFALLSICLLLIGDKPANPLLEEQIDQYSIYLDKVKGQLSAESEHYLQAEAHKLNEAKTSLDCLYDDYYDGKIPKQEFIQEQNRLENSLRNQGGFEQIFQQYVFMRENQENRYFVYTNGWDALLAGEAIDFTMLIIILLLVTPVFCQEFENAMGSLTITMKKGGSYQAIYKIVLVYLSITLLCLFSAGLRYAFYSLKYGLPDGDYPIQSLAYFSLSVKNISLKEAFLSISCIRLFGYLSYATMVLFLSVWIKKYALTLFTCSAAIVLPLIGIGNVSAKYLYTGPLGFMIATGYFRGDLLVTDRLTKETTQIFEEITAITLFLLLLFVLVVTVLMLYILLRLRSNHWCGIKRKSGNRICAFVSFCAALFALTGCASSTDYDIYNYTTHRVFQNEKCRFYLDESNVTDIKLVYENLETGLVENFIKTPLQSLSRIEKTIYGRGDSVYYIKYNVNRSEFRDFIDRISIIEVDTRTFSEKIIYEKYIDIDNMLLMGTIPNRNKDLFFLHAVNAFFLDESNIYFIGSTVTRLNRASGKIKQLDIPTNNNIAYDGQRIYFIGDRYEISYFDTKTESYEVIPGVVATRFFLTDGELFFLNRMDEKKLYALNLSDNAVRKVLNKTVLNFYCDDTFIYYQDMEDLKEYKINRSVS